MRGRGRIGTSENNTLFRGTQPYAGLVFRRVALVGPGIPRSGLRPPGSVQDTYTSPQRVQTLLTPLGGFFHYGKARQNPPRQRVPRPLARPASRAEGRSPTAIHKGNSSHNESSSDRPTACWQAAQRLAERANLSIWGGSRLCRRRWFAAVDV